MALRRESRKTLSVKYPRVQLYICGGTPTHQIECVLVVHHTDLLGQPKKLLTRYSTRGARAQAALAQEDYDE